MFKRMMFKLGTSIGILVMVIACIKESGIDQSLIKAWNQFTQSELLEKATTLVDAFVGISEKQ